MNLVEKLIRIDKSKAFEREEKEIKSARLSKILGEPTKIKIRELKGKTLNDLTQMIMNKDGSKNFAKMQDMNLMYCVHGVVEPDLKDKSLMEHFGATTPKDLAAILFDAEAGNIANEIVSLSGIGTDSEEEVKNS